MTAWVELIGGLVILTLGAEFLVRGASAIAKSFGISALVVGMTVVAYGTSAPELAVSVVASLRGAGGVAIGNVVGSNITNLGLVLGLAAMIRPLHAEASLLRRELPFMLVAAAMVPALGWDGNYDRGDGIALLLGALLFTSACLVRAMQEGRQQSTNAAPRSFASIAQQAVLLVLGMAGLVGGGELLVRGAVQVATNFGVSERMIGLTVVAFGTSVPELVTSLVAASKGEMELAVGNVIGSNIFNIFFILGSAALINPIVRRGPPLTEDILIMLLLSLAMIPMIWTGQQISRREGALLGIAYLGFLLTVFL